VAFNLGVDPRKADQMVRGSLTLPNGTGKTQRILVFADGDQAKAAEEAGADFVGADELVQKIQKENWLEFDVIVATPKMMPKIGALGRVLGPRGLMPNPKIGTVTNDVANVISEIKKGKVSYKVDKTGNLHFIAGKISFETSKLVENIQAIMNEVSKVKPSSAKGTYMKNVALSSTMGPSVKLDPKKS
jgi:large subunit ribosomal protein L1